ncbi:MAG: hypothetical protein V4606_02710 [Patescibacteria group bacterium]
MFVLGSYKGNIQLVEADFPGGNVEPGQRFDRMPTTVLEKWQVIKAFDHESQQRLKALQVLIGHVALCSLFEI